MKDIKSETPRIIYLLCFLFYRIHYKSSCNTKTYIAYRAPHSLCSKFAPFFSQMVINQGIDQFGCWGVKDIANEVHESKYPECE